MKKTLLFILLSLCSLPARTHANSAVDAPPTRKVSIIGGGIVGALESYYAYKDAQKDGKKICITIYEKGDAFACSSANSSECNTSNTSYNIVSSLTSDEILAVIPRGSDLVKKLSIPFSSPGGIGIEDVPGVNDSNAAIEFKEAVAISAVASAQENSSTNTSYNIVPSLTIDEILSVVPRGAELVNKLKILFSHPGGIRVDDVHGINDSKAAKNFKESVAIYGNDKNHDDRTHTLLKLGKMSMELWQEIYDQGDDELKNILEASNLNPCREPRNDKTNSLHDGYRIDLIYGIPDAEQRALNMKADYEKLGYKNCKILSPEEVVRIDPYLADFCKDHTIENNWNKDTIALWRPGGCIDMHVFLPKFYRYLKRVMGQYQNNSGQMEDCFHLKFNREVTAVLFDTQPDSVRVCGLQFKNGSQVLEDQQFQDQQFIDSKYVFCPGEAIGTLHKLGFHEPAYAAFAGASLFLNIPITSDQLQMYKTFSHCMEVHKEGIVLAWQARVKENSIFIGVAGTKAFYGDKQPNKNEAFAKNRNLVQLNMINHVLPEFISLAFGYDSHGKQLTDADMAMLESKGIVQRWVGRRSVAYDGFPTFGPLYCNNQRVTNARCTTHLGSGGVSFGPAAAVVSRSSEGDHDAFIEKVLKYADSRRVAEVN